MSEVTARSLFVRISAMEQDLLHSQWLCIAVRQLGQTNEALVPEALFALGTALEERMHEVKAQWEELHRMAVELSGHTRQPD